jgi:hemoglobin/transferrin/lactoferrin receptor protein
MRYWIFVLVSLLATEGMAQTLTVLDKSNLQPIEHVAIVNLEMTRTALTNRSGEASLSIFTTDDTLFFQHPAYQDLLLPYADLSRLNFQVTLTKSTISLSEYVVSASKWEQKREEVPNRITRIDPNEVAYLNPPTTADLLGSTSDVFIQKSQLGGGSPMIRGFSANSVLIVVDGVRMNNAIYRSGNLQNVLSVDANTLEEAEVIYGPGSIIYGSDALGGVMDFHTREINPAEDGSSSVQGQAYFRYGTAANEKTGHAEVSYSRKKWGSYTSLTYSDFGDLTMGRTGPEEYLRKHYVTRDAGTDRQISNTHPEDQIESGYDQYNLTQKLAWWISEEVSLEYGLFLANTTNIPRYDRLIEYDADSSLTYAEWYYGPQFWMMNTLTLSMNGSKKAYDHARITLGYQNVEESRHDRRFQSPDLRSRTENVDVYSLNVDVDKKITEKGTLFYGLEGIYNYVSSQAQTEDLVSGGQQPASTRYPDGGSDYLTGSAYLNLKSNIHPKITLQTGLRYSYIYAYSRFEDTTFYSFPYSSINLQTGALTGSLGAVFRAAENSRINLNLSSGFRAPNIDDLAKVFDSEPGRVVVPNENLQPEYAYNADLGLIRSFGPNVRVEVTGFYTYITNLMVRRDAQFNGQDSILYDGTLSRVLSIQNAASAWITGISMDVRADLSNRIGFRGSLNYLDGEDNEGESIRHVPPVFGSAGFTYTAKKIKLDVWTDFNGQISNANLAPSEKGKPQIYAVDDQGNPYSPSWYTINLAGFYQINPNLQVNMGIENLLNKRYRPYSSGIAAPGLNFILALRASF